jgi:hypothetical protein
MANSSIVAKSSMNEEQRYAQHMEQRKTEHEKGLRELASHQEDEVTELVDRYKTEKTAIEKSFNVSISEESKRQAERLETLRKSHNAEYESEKKKLDDEFSKLSVRERARVENYQKKQEENLAKLHARYQTANEELRKQNGDV